MRPLYLILLIYSLPLLLSIPFVGWTWSIDDNDVASYGPSFFKQRWTLHLPYRNPLNCGNCKTHRFSTLHTHDRRELARYCRDAFRQPDIVECVARRGERWSGEPRSANWADPLTDAWLREEDERQRHAFEKYIDQCRRDTACIKREGLSWVF